MSEYRSISRMIVSEYSSPNDAERHCWIWIRLGTSSEHLWACNTLLTVVSFYIIPNTHCIKNSAYWFFKVSFTLSTFHYIYSPWEDSIARKIDGAVTSQHFQGLSRKGSMSLLVLGAFHCLLHKRRYKCSSWACLNWLSPSQSWGHMPLHAMLITHLNIPTTIVIISISPGIPSLSKLLLLCY